MYMHFDTWINPKKIPNALGRPAQKVNKDFIKRLIIAKKKFFNGNAAADKNNI